MSVIAKNGGSGSVQFGTVKFHYEVDTNSAPIRRVGPVEDATYELTDNLKASRLRIYDGTTLRMNGHDIEIGNVILEGTLAP